MKKITLGSFRETWQRYQRYQRFLPYLALGLIFLSTFSLLQSGWERISRLKESNAKEEKRVALLATRVSQVESISVAEIGERIQNATFALPRVKDPLLTLSSAKALALESHLMIEEISFSPGEIRKENSESKKSASLEEIAINFSLQGLPEDVRHFVQKSVKRSPLISLNSLSLDFTSLESGMVGVKVAANTFFAPVDSNKFSEKTEITLQPSEDKLYQQVALLEKTGTSPIAEGAEFIPFDEERDPFAPSSAETTKTDIPQVESPEN